METGLSLRDAYKIVLRCRPGIDPLPPYRQSLLEHEKFLHEGRTTVEEENDLFHLHLAQLMQLVAKAKLKEEESNDDDKHLVDLAIEQRKDAVAKLLNE